MKNKPKFNLSTTNFERNYSEYVTKLKNLEHLLSDLIPALSFKPTINSESQRKVKNEWNWQSFLERNKRYTEKDVVDMKQSNSDEDLHGMKRSDSEDDLEFFPRLNNETVRIILERHINGQMIDLNLHLKKNRINF